MNTKGFYLCLAIAALALTTATTHAQGVDFYTDGSRINNPDGCAAFCCLQTDESLQNYQEDGLTVDVNSVHFIHNPCGFGDQHYYPRGGVAERIRITKTDGNDFGKLEFQVSHGWAGCTVWLWVTPFLDGASLGDFPVDVASGTLVGIEGQFDLVLVGSYSSAAVRDQLNEANSNAVVLDNACFQDGSDCLTLAVDPLVAGASADWNVSGATAGEQVAIVFGFSPGVTIVNGFVGYCATFGINGVNQNRLICTKTANGAGDLTCTKQIPAGARGLRVLSQASERNTCPNECMSNVDDQVVG